MSNYGLPSAGTSYDDEDRLTGFARASGTFTQSWSLTSVGDWNSITTNGTAQNRTPHVLPHSRHLFPDCSCSFSSSSLSPPASGLLPDFDNKLKSADVDNNGSNDVTFQYDALGRRIARQGTSGSFVHVQHDQQTIADYGYGDAPSSPTHRYVVASYIDEPVVRKAAGTSGTIHYLQRNQQYSITAVTTSSGSVAERYAYTAYGQPTILDGSGSILSSSAINNRYTYTGREWDQTLGLYHFRARWMSGIAGRFMGRDPIGFWGGEALLYGFVGEGPTNACDPSGLRRIRGGNSGSGKIGGGRTTNPLGDWFAPGTAPTWENRTILYFPRLPRSSPTLPDFPTPGTGPVLGPILGPVNNPNPPLAVPEIVAPDRRPIPIFDVGPRVQDNECRNCMEIATAMYQACNLLTGEARQSCIDNADQFARACARVCGVVDPPNLGRGPDYCWCCEFTNALEGNGGTPKNCRIETVESCHDMLPFQMYTDPRSRDTDTTQMKEDPENPTSR
ncbi:RHS repeat domain-containing protein [Pirellulaceae bacterium SH467]